MKTAKYAREAMELLRSDMDHVELSLERIYIRERFEQADPDDPEDLAQLMQILQERYLAHAAVLERESPDQMPQEIDEPEDKNRAKATRFRPLLN
ncbi:MAG: hypothetical protein ACOYBP_09080 [Microbacteriaceae bacterium]